MDTVHSYFSGNTESEIRERIAKGTATASDAEWLAKLLDITRSELALVRADNAGLRAAPYQHRSWPQYGGWPQIWCSTL